MSDADGPAGELSGLHQQPAIIRWLSKLEIWAGMVFFGLIFFGIMRELSASVLLYSVGSEVLSVVLLRMWENGQAETVSVIGLMMMLLVFVFRWVQLRLIKRYISTL